MRPVPYSFAKAVRDYDALLHVSWCNPLQCYVIEREFRNKPPDQVALIKGVHHRIANRNIPEGMGMAPERLDRIIKRRRKAQARLEALNRGREIVLWLEDVEHETLQAVLYTLRQGDLWSQFNVQPGETEDVAATRIATQMAYEEDYEDREREIKRGQANRDMAADAYMPLLFKCGSAVSMAGG